MKCQQVKVEHQHPAGLLQPLSVLEWKWEVVSQDFTIGFPMTWRQHDSIMAVVDKLIKEAHFILVKSTDKTVGHCKNLHEGYFQIAWIS